MATHRMLPPLVGKGSNPITFNGRTYAAGVGAAIDVPDYDAIEMAANGWIDLGATGTVRPTTGLYRGLKFHDTSVGVDIYWDGVNWRSGDNGSVV